MLKEFNDSTGGGEKKRLARNPFKPPTPVKRQHSSGGSQQTLSFFKSKSSNSLGLSPVARNTNPLVTASSSSLNRQDEVPTQPDVFYLKRSSSSISSLSKTPSFQDDIDDDVIIVKSQTANLKNSKPIGSLLTGLKPLEQKSVITSSRHLSQSSSQSSSQLSSQPMANRSNSLNKFTPKLSLGKLDKNSNGQTKLNFGDKNIGPRKRATSPWDAAPALSKIKNPRIKEETVRVNRMVQSSLFLSTEQQKVLDIAVREKKSIFYTGSAGTGKSVLLKELVKNFVSMYGANAVAVTASTGIAAVNIGGTTINRFSGFGYAKGTKQQIFHKIKRNNETKERWKRTKVLIIDEISMLDGRFLDKLEYVARSIRKVQIPFGGIQVILTGDFFQLPPVDQKPKEGPHIPPIFCFESECWRSCIKQTILLKQVFRQADNDFVNLLNAVRVADVSEEVAKQFMGLSREVKYDDGLIPTELFSTRYEVDSSNSRRLRSLPGKVFTFVARDSGNEKLRFLLENTMAAKSLDLKEDAQVMMLKNLSETLVNGSLGKVITFLSKPIYTLVKTNLVQEYRQTDVSSIDEMRMLNRCYNQSEIPPFVLEFASKHANKDKFLDIARQVLYDTQEPLPLIHFNSHGVNTVHLVEREEFKAGPANSEDELNTLSREQVPLLLSWALSIHKSQGQTLERVKVDLTKVFEAGQVYVALSRAVSKDRLQVINFQKSKIKTNEKVKTFYRGLESL